MEDVLAHSLWELSLPFFNDFKTSTPVGRVLHAVHELFPGIPTSAFTVHRELKLNGGQASNDDVVSFMMDGSMNFGQLKLAVGISANS